MEGCLLGAGCSGVLLMAKQQQQQQAFLVAQTHNQMDAYLRLAFGKHDVRLRKMINSGAKLFAVCRLLWSTC